MDNLGFEFHLGQEIYVFQYVQTGFRYKPASYLMGAWGSLLGAKWSEHETVHSPP